MTNLEKGGKEYMAWIRGLAQRCGGDVMYDIHLYGRDDLYDLWKSGMSPKELFEKRYEK